MSFFSKIKQGLGIGTLKVELDVPGQVAKSAGEVKGKVLLAAKSDQLVKEIKVRMVESYTTGRGDEKKTKEFDLGTTILRDPRAIKKDENQTVEFTLPFVMLRSSNQSLAEEKGVLGALGKAAVFAKNEKSEYSIKVDVSLEGTLIGPGDSKEIVLL